MNDWKIKGAPHKGWTCIGVEDLEEPDGSCDMCGQTEIRFMHSMQHPEFDKVLEVGCVCACAMENKYAPKARERELRNRANRKSKWLQRKWRESAKGNSYLNTNGLNVGTVETRHGWSYRIGGHFSISHYQTENQAKLALFDALNKK